MKNKGTIFSITIFLLFIVIVSYLDLTSTTESHYEEETFSVTYFNAPTNSSCYSCHSNLPGLLDERISKPATDWQNSIHYSDKSLLMCVKCHGGNSSTYIIFDSKSKEDGYINSYDAETSIEICGHCHEEQLEDYKTSIHWLSEDDKVVCTDCHGKHNIKSTSDPDSRTHRANIPEFCGSCHTGEYTTYYQTFHGKNHNLGNMNAAVCTDCHATHAVMPKSEPGSTIHNDNHARTCSLCHKNENDVKLAKGAEHDDINSHEPTLMFDRSDMSTKEKSYYIGPIDLEFYIPTIYTFLIIMFIFTLCSLMVLELFVSKIFRGGK